MPAATCSPDCVLFDGSATCRRSPGGIFSPASRRDEPTSVTPLNGGLPAATSGRSSGRNLTLIRAPTMTDVERIEYVIAHAGSGAPAELPVRFAIVNGKKIPPPPTRIPVVSARPPPSTPSTPQSENTMTCTIVAQVVDKTGHRRLVLGRRVRWPPPRPRPTPIRPPASPISSPARIPITHRPPGGGPRLRRLPPARARPEHRPARRRRPRRSTSSRSTACTARPTSRPSTAATASSPSAAR